MKTLCGLDCSECGLRDHCGGCAETNGRPFGGTCMVAVCCEEKGCENCCKSFEASCRLKEQLIAEFNALGIEDMEKVTSLNALKGSFVNLEYTLPGGQTIKFWEDDRIYLLDSDKKQIHIFEPTEFTNLLHESLYLFSKGQYTQSKEPLSKVLQMNSMFDYANQAMGHAYLQEENYEQSI